MAVPTPFLISAFVNWMAYKLTSPFVLQRLNGEVDTLRLGVFILLGMTGAVGYRHLEDVLQLFKAAKLILVHHPPPLPSKLVAFLREEGKEWKGAQEDFQHARRGLAQLALYSDLDVTSLRAALEVLEHWQYGTRDPWAETLSSAYTFKAVLVFHQAIHAVQVAEDTNGTTVQEVSSPGASTRAEALADLDTSDPISDF